MAVGKRGKAKETIKASPPVAGKLAKKKVPKKAVRAPQNLAAAARQLLAEQQAHHAELEARNAELLLVHEALRERVKELDCLHGISTLMQSPGASLGDIMEGVVTLIPPAWQFPEITAARITLAGRMVGTAHFRDTPWMLARDIRAQGRPVGALQVCYLEERPASDEGPFLLQERRLLDSIAERLGHVLERLGAEEALQASEQQYRSLFEHMAEGCVYCRATGGGAEPRDFVLLAANAAFETLVGSADVAGQRVTEVIPDIGETDPELLEICARVSLTGAPEQFEMFVQALELWVSFSVYSPEQGYFVAVFEDITGRKRAEEALRESEARYRRIAEGLTDYQYTVDIEDGRAVETTQGPACASVTGYTAQEYAANPFLWIEMVTPEDRDRVREQARRVLAGEDVPAIEHRIVRKDGAVRWVSDTAILHRDASGRLLSYDGVITDITERKEAEEALAQERFLLQALMNNIPDRIYFKDRLSRLLRISRAMAQLFGVSDPAQAVGKTDFDFFTAEHALQAYEDEQAIIRTGQPVTKEERETWADRPDTWVWTTKAPLRDEAGKVVGTFGISRDITARKRAEEEKAAVEAHLQQSQKMEMVGRLAGGLAHDFNNMLEVILGRAELVLANADSPSGPEVRAHLEEIQQAAKRSADLMRQLLAFARQQTIAPAVLDLNEIVAGLRTMIQRLIGEDVDLLWQPGAELWPVEVDQSQIGQVLANLCVNARDAIADVGTITIETANGTFDADYCAQHAGFLPGEYVRLAVSDDGRGMDQETLSHVFEPFFTTKSAGQGTGLGLAMVWGIVEQNNGFIDVHSEPGHGSTFAIYLPRTAGEVAPARPAAAAGPLGRGHETILLVEDEPAILELTKEMLELQGYTVLAAGSPGEALRLAGEHGGPIHLLLSDVVMPKMNGRDLARNLVALLPHLRLLFMSGYSADVIAQHGVQGEGVPFLEKPFSSQSLAAKVREALDGA